MSVINDMLRDLEQRKAAGRAGLNQVGALPVVQAASSPVLQTWLLAILIVLLALSLGVWFWPSTSAPTLTEAVAAQQEVPVATPIVPMKEQLKEAPKDEPKEAPKEESKQALATPVLKEVKAEVLLPVVKATVTPEPEPVAEVAAKPEPVAEVEQTPQVQSQKNSTQAPQEQAKTAVEPSTELTLVELAPEMPVAEFAPRPVVSLTPQAQDLKVAAEAQTLLRRGDVDSALRKLNLFLEEAEVDRKSRAVLVNYLLQYARLAEAGDLLAGAPVDKDPDLRQLKARWLVSNARPKEAVSLLESSKPKVEEFPDYHALLASYYQQLGQAEPAAQVYAELLQFNPGHANWWAGRALALDRLARYDEAKIAYKRALALPGLSEQLAQFAKQRLENL